MCRRIGELFLNDYCDFAEANGFHQNLVGLQQDGVHGERPYEIKGSNYWKKAA
jgi:hypothetical protein